MKRIAGGLLAAALAVGGCRTLPPVCTARTEATANEVWLTPQEIRDAGIRSDPAALTEITTGGALALDDRRVARLFSPVTGRVTRLFAEPGARVKAGGPLATIRREPADMTADLNRAEADLIAAEHNLARAKELDDADRGPERALEAVQDEYDQAQATATRAREEAQRRRAGGAVDATEDRTLFAPIDGEVLARNVNVGADVQGTSSGDGSVELFAIGGLDHLWLFAALLPADLPRVRVGAPVRVMVATYPGEDFPGKVDWISAALDLDSHTARIRCAISNPDLKLRPETYATADISVQGSATSELPRSAIVRLAGQSVVFIEAGRAPDGRLGFVPRVITLGGAIDPRERVVVAGASFLSGMALARGTDPSFSSQPRPK